MGEWNAETIHKNKMFPKLEIQEHKKIKIFSI
jgi:hypothetical protein